MTKDGTSPFRRWQLIMFMKDVGIICSKLPHFNMRLQENTQIIKSEAYKQLLIEEKSLPFSLHVRRSFV